MARATRNSVSISEALLARVWQRQLVEGLVTAEGEPLRVVYPGRANPNGGPDFLRAILVTPRGEVRGDVEIHLRSSQWQSHGHHRDPEYNGVVLHVVFCHEVGETRRENGERVPILPLEGRLKGSLEEVKRSLELAPEPCGQGIGEEALGWMLDKWGEERFQAKAQGFGRALKKEKPDQVLYEGLMGALGYARNQEPMEGLARRLPFSQLRDRVQAGEGATSQIHRLLLQAGGSLPWRQGGVRPANLPQPRLISAAHLLLRYLERGLAAGMAELVKEAENHRELEAGLVGKGIGWGRAGEMAVNVVLPFFAAWGGERLRKKAWGLFFGYPPLPENYITRHMARELLGEAGRGSPKTARRQQGLIHLYKGFCQEGKCPQCPLKTTTT